MALFSSASRLVTPGAESSAPPKNRYMVSATYDWAFFISSPIVTLLLALFLEKITASGDVSTTILFGAREAWLSVFIAIWTAAHLFAVFFRSHGNPEIFRRFPYRFTLVPLLLFAGFYASSWLLVSGFVLAVFWDVYHTAMQNFGFCRIYDSRLGNNSDRARRLDIGLNQLLYVGPIVGGLSYAETIGALKMFARVDWLGGSRLAVALESLQPQLTLVFIIGGTIYLLYYLHSYRQLVAQGYNVSPQKVCLLFSVGISSVWAWGFLPPFWAFFVANFYHGLQYFAIVWASEKKSVRRVFGLSSSKAGNGLILCIFVLTVLAAGVTYTLYGVFSVQWGIALFTTISLLHFWYDSFVWSAREVRAA